jgi:hypothetical protein
MVVNSGGARGGLSPPERKLSSPGKFYKAPETSLSDSVSEGLRWAEPIREEISGAATSRQAS